MVTPTGYIEKDKCETVTIEGALKPKIREYLRNFHNIHSDTIYNDLIGFIANEENNTAARKAFYKGRAKQNAKDYKRAIVHYDKAIELNTQYAIVYQYRGAAKFALGREEEAFEDYSKAIGLF